MGETFGERLARLREEAGMTRTVLAFHAGRSEAWLRQVETGQVQEPSFQVGVRLARALGVRADYLATGEGPRERTPDAAQLAEATPPEGSLERRLSDLAEVVAQSDETTGTALRSFEQRLQAVEAAQRRRRQA